MVKVKYECEECYSTMKLKDKGSHIGEYCLHCQEWRIFRIKKKRRGLFI